ncbi:immunity protein YezG family protein [Bacillus safensis]|uniref:immunity protein YezG family protein n=1 Tax=Bacillus safensis TaxID=561879 RepID=UPI000DAB71C3|nr:immunity protein YezG family protein [Bacillus safensis]
MIPCNWGKVWLYAKIVDDSSEVIFYFRNLDDEELIYEHKIPIMGIPMQRGTVMIKKKVCM